MCRRTRWHSGTAPLALLLLVVLTGCAHAISGTATWPGARLEKIVLTAADFPPGVQYDSIFRSRGQPDGAGGPPAMMSKPEGCSDGLTRAIARYEEALRLRLPAPLAVDARRRLAQLTRGADTEQRIFYCVYD